MKILIDTNVVLDVLLKREPFFHDAVRVLNLSKKDNMKLFVSASAVTDIYYIANQELRNKTEIKNLLLKLLQVVSVANVSEDTIKNALALPWKDFEDSVQYSTALLQKMEGIVTRNPKDYKEAKIDIWTPGELLLRL